MSDLQTRAVDIRRRFASFELSTYGREWTTADLVSGLMTDVGDLAAAIQRADGIRPERDTSPLDELCHELGDCLWVLFVLADRYDIALGEAFAATMDELEHRLGSG